jgi:hypothetical protein
MTNKFNSVKKTEKSVCNKDQMQFSECRKILNKNVNQFSDDEIIEICNFISQLADVFINHYQYDVNQQGKIINLEEYKQSHHGESNYLRTG